MQIAKVSGLVLSIFFGVSCGHQENLSSSLQGHYEDSTNDEMEKFRGQQSVIAEHEEVEGVIVGLPLISDYQKEDLVAAILDAGVETVWITTERNRTFSKDDRVFRKLQRLLNERMSQVEIVPQAANGLISVWARDWAPLAAAPKGEFLSKELRLVDFNYYPRRQADDATGRAFETVYSLNRVSVPVYNEGGNFMANRFGDCMMTTRVIDANRDTYFEDDIVLNKEEIETYYKDFAGCQQVYIFKRMPYESTGHIDMWAKFLDDETIIVGQIDPAALEFLKKRSRDYQAAIKVQKFLNDRADEIEGLGFQVIRIPMPVPQVKDYEVFLSYTNSLLVNGTAIIPQYKNGEYGRYADYDFLDTYEKKVRKVYEQAGYKAVFISSDSLISSGGAVHCVTMQLPKI